MNNGLIISGREVRFGHACSTSLRCGHSIQLKGNNFLATPREVGGSAKLVIIVAFKLFFAIFCVCVFCIFLIASPLVALPDDHSLGLAGNASNLYFVFRNPPTTWELTPRHRSSPLQIPETAIQRDFAAQFPPPPSPFYVTCLFLTF